MKQDQLLQEFFSKYTKLQYKKGEIILRAGDPPPGALYLKDGFVRMSLAAPTGDMLVLHVFAPGSCLPMPWIVNETPNRYDFEAMTPVEIWRSPREDALKFITSQPDVHLYLMSKMLNGLTGFMQRMEYLVFDSAYKKTILLLLYYAKHFADAGKQKAFIIPLTHKEIAAWIGTTRETASLQIEALKAKGLIRYNRRYIVIPSRELLERESARNIPG